MSILFGGLQANLVEIEKRRLEFSNVQMFFNSGSILRLILGRILNDEGLIVLNNQKDATLKQIIYLKVKSIII